MGYQLIKENEDRPAPLWWHSEIWHIKCPLKHTLFLWPTLSGKILVWDHLSSFMGYRLGQCALFMNDEDSVNQIFIHCSYFIEMWKYAYTTLSRHFIW